MVSWLPGHNVLCQSPGKDRHTEFCPVTHPSNTHTLTHPSWRRIPHAEGRQPGLQVCDESSRVTCLEDSAISVTPKASVDACPSAQTLVGPAQWKMGRSARKPLWRLTPTTGGERLHYSLSGSGILSSRLLNWVWLPGKVILPKANWQVHVTPHSGWQSCQRGKKRDRPASMGLGSHIC